MAPNFLDRFGGFAGKPGAVLLDSCSTEDSHGNGSLMAVDPFLTVQAKGDVIRVHDSGGDKTIRGNGLEWLESALARFAREKTPPGAGDSFFGPGAMGYFSYEMGNKIQGIPTLPKDDLEIPDMWFAFYDRVKVFHPGDARQRGQFAPQFPPPAFSPPENDFSERSLPYPLYRRSFDQAMEHIGCGNIYQVNLCQRFSAPFAMDPWQAYLQMRSSHPAEFSAFLNAGDRFILSASPELFLKKEGNRIETMPIKGTISRTGDLTLDERLEKDLQANAKDRAEHIMIVDLERNDLGRICETGSIKPEKLFRVQRCGKVSHMVSTVSGSLRENAGLREILNAVFPGGSVTGAPKRKAMEIIGTLEPVVRGIYTGALGWIGFNGNFIFNLPIRTLLIQNRFAHFYAGGGVVADSTPMGEYMELLSKGSAFLDLLGIKTDVPHPACL